MCQHTNSHKKMLQNAYINITITHTHKSVHTFAEVSALEGSEYISCFWQGYLLINSVIVTNIQ